MIPEYIWKMTAEKFSQKVSTKSVRKSAKYYNYFLKSKHGLCFVEFEENGVIYGKWFHSLAIFLEDKHSRESNMYQTKKETLITHPSFSTLQFGCLSPSHNISTALLFVPLDNKSNSLNLVFFLSISAKDPQKDSSRNCPSSLSQKVQNITITIPSKRNMDCILIWIAEYGYIWQMMFLPGYISRAQTVKRKYIKLTKKQWSLTLVFLFYSLDVGARYIVFRPLFHLDCREITVTLLIS